MKKKLRFFCLIMAVMMFVCCLPLNVLADSFIVAGEEFDYYLNENGTYTITGYSGESEVLEIPAYINGIAVTALGVYSLYNNYRFEKIILPETMEKIEECALTCNGNLEYIEVAEDNPYLCDVDGVLFDKNITTVIYYPEGLDDKIYTLPSTVTTLGNYSFHYTNLETLNLPSALKRIEYRAFYCASNLKNIVLPDGIEFLGDGAFYFCESLKDIVIPDSVTYVGYTVFSDCTDLETVHFGSGITDVKENVLQDCSSLVSITVSEGNRVLLVEDGVLFNKEKTELIKYPSKKAEITYTVPSSVKTIKRDAFSKVEHLEKIDFPKSLVCIEDDAFRELDSLKSVVIPDSVTDFGYNFTNCESLKSAYIGKNVEYVEPYSTFRSCAAFTSVEVSSENIYYSSMNGVLFNKDKTELVIYPAGLSVENYVIPSTVKEVFYVAFSDTLNYSETLYDNGEIYVGDCLLEYDGYNNKKQGNVSVKTGTRIIGESAFSMENTLWAVSLPEELRVICREAFAHCYMLQAVYIPEGVKYMGIGVFRDCNMLTDIYYGGTQEQWNKIENIENIGLRENVTIHFESTGNEYVNPVLPEDDYLNTYLDEESGISVSTDTNAILSAENVMTQEIVDMVAELMPKAKVESVYEINLKDEYNEEIQPVDSVLVKIPTKNRFARVYRMEEDGTLTDMNARYEDGYLWFYTDHFSYYALGMKQAEHYELGDVDMDERINVKDATAVQKHLAEISVYQQDVIDLLMDYDQNGTINVKDATAIQKKVAGLV